MADWDTFLYTKYPPHSLLPAEGWSVGPQWPLEDFYKSYPGRSGDSLGWDFWKILVDYPGGKDNLPILTKYRYINVYFVYVQNL